MNTTILQHIIEYNWDEGYEDLEMNDVDIAHVKKCIEDGYNEGELCQTIDDETGDEARGWWKLKRM